MQQRQLSRLMRMSWEIQRRRRSGRSKSLRSAWAIFQNEDITVYHLVKKHGHEHYPNKSRPQHLGLFREDDGR